jgi:hypothetical protein
MADYLKSLVARVSQKTPALSPRVPSLFEPPPGLLSVPLPMTTRRQTTPPVAAPTTPIATNADPQPQVPAAAAARRADTAPVPEMQVAVEVSNDTPAPRLVRSSKPQSEPATLEPDLEIVEAEPVASVRPLIARAHPEPTAPVVAETAPTIRPTFAPTRAPQEPVAAGLQPTRTDRGAPEPVQTVNVAPSPQRSQEPARQSPSLREQATRSQEVADQRPVVNVVIERLSVQAVTNTSSPPRPSAPAPAPSMSLEQYLQRRSSRS